MGWGGVVLAEHYEPVTYVIILGASKLRALVGGHKTHVAALQKLFKIRKGDLKRNDMDSEFALHHQATAQEIGCEKQRFFGIFRW